ncbi:Hypothetical protein Minf_0146 [Methylacidiphilum infernorum V4]|uniref:Uncharacterized protein n=1 Tax=Methylacidiphilum infernorum (isolate V4) TaxID=481448 RepID=B3DXH2_METI4|nr:Hypothetical protein Minf_0146 [Methylacidiphilum infernorum V4]
MEPSSLPFKKFRQNLKFPFFFSHSSRRKKVFNAKDKATGSLSWDLPSHSLASSLRKSKARKESPLSLFPKTLTR